MSEHVPWSFDFLPHRINISSFRRRTKILFETFMMVWMVGWIDFLIFINPHPITFEYNNFWAPLSWLNEFLRSLNVCDDKPTMCPWKTYSTKSTVNLLFNDTPTPHALVMALKFWMEKNFKVSMQDLRVDLASSNCLYFWSALKLV